MTQTKILTDEQIEQGRQAVFSTNNPFCPCDSKTMRKAARWAEQAVLQSPEVQAMRWQPIETAPQGQIALFYNANATEVRACMFVDWVVDGAFCGNRFHEATHWTPLPAPPADAAMEVKP